MKNKEFSSPIKHIELFKSVVLNILCSWHAISVVRSSGTFTYELEISEIHKNQRAQLSH